MKYNYPTELEIQIPRDSAVHVSPTEGQKRSKILTQRSLFIRLINTELKIYPGFATFGVFQFGPKFESQIQDFNENEIPDFILRIPFILHYLV